MKTSYTRHAWTRVLGRLSLSPAEVADLLDWNLCVDIGVEGGSRRVHRLFFSVPDNMCFVAVQDEGYGAVITVLPIDFHENIAWQVGLSAQEAARALAEGQVRPHVAVFETPKTPADTGPQVFKIGAYLRTPTGSVKGVNLGSWPCRRYDNRVENLLEDDEFFKALSEKLTAKGAHLDEVETFFVRLGHQGSVTRISPAVLRG